MNSVALQDKPTFHGQEEFQYRSVSKAAVASLVFGILGLTSFLFPMFVVLPAIGAGFGFLALTHFKKFPDELVGKIAAQIGLLISLICLVCSVAMHSYVYATEVPDGYQRISYGFLRDNPKTPLPFSENAKEIDGQKVFLKGYVRPSVKKTNLKQFMLVGDFGECCFGGNPKISEVVAIDIRSDDTVNYSYRLRRIGGTFRLNPQTAYTADKDVPQVYYVIEADHVK